MSKFLIVDDDPEGRSVLVQLLEAQGHRVAVASDGREALRLARDERPDAIVSDVMMPGLNGFMLCRELKGDAELRAIPFVFYSATFVDSDDEELALGLGAARYLTKPLDGDRLIGILGDVLEETHGGPRAAVVHEALSENELARMHEQALMRKLDLTVQKLRAERRALERSEHRLREAQEIGQIGHWELEPSTGRLRWSDQLYRLLGLAPGRIEPDYERALDLIDPRDRARVQAAIDGVVIKKTPFEIEFRLCLADGLVKQVLARCQVQLDESGEIDYLIGTLQDVTSRRESEAALRGALDRLNRARSAARLGEWEWEPGPDRLTGTPEFHAMLGAPELASEPRLDDFLARVRPEERELAALALRMTRDTGAPLALELRLDPPDGPPAAVRVHAELAPTSGDAAPRLVGTLQDVSDLRRVEATRDQLATAVEQTAEMIALCDPDGIVHYVNPAFTRTTGLTPEAVLGQPLPLLDRGGANASEAAAIWARIETGAVWRGTHVGLRSNGTGFEEDVTISPVRDSSGRLLDFVAVARDVTHEREFQSRLAQTQKMEAIGQLASGIAHDFNNLLSAIMGFTEVSLLELEGQDAGMLSSNLEQVLSAAHRAKDLVQQILTFSRPGERREEPVVLSELARESLRMLRATLPSTIEIESRLESDAAVMSDPAQLQQVLMNLATNASRAIGEGGGRLVVSVREVEVGPERVARFPALSLGGHLLLEVEDDGCGMPPEVRDRIFEPFFTTRDQGEGTGLGLAVVHGIVQRLHGAIDVDSEVDRGTRFSVFLPIASEMGQARVEFEEGLPGGSEHVLFVDDEAYQRELVANMLGRLGYRVTTHADSREALEAFRAAPDAFDLVLTDQTMPRMTGLELSRALRGLRPELPILLCTGYTSEDTEREAHESGLRRILRKPLRVAEAARALREELDRAPA